MEEKQKIHRATHFGITEYVINMNLICNGYEFDIYLIQFQWNRCMIKNGFGEKRKIHRAAHFGTTEYVNDVNLICNGYEFDMFLIQLQWNRCMI